eukprot:scaffold43787_cov24-Cyclotella_meneghiniana.AAC.2
MEIGKQVFSFESLFGYGHLFRWLDRPDGQRVETICRICQGKIGSLSSEIPPPCHIRVVNTSAATGTHGLIHRISSGVTRKPVAPT